MITAFIITVLSLLAANAAIIIAYRGIVDGLRGQNRDLFDRWLVSKGLPPSGIDMKATHEKREAAKEQVRSTLPRADTLTHARHKLIAEERVN